MNSEELTVVLNGGELETQNKQLIYKLWQNDPYLMCKHKSWHELSLEQIREFTMTQISRVLEYRSLWKNNSQHLLKALDQVIMEYDPSLQMRLYVHDLFHDTLACIGTDQQYQKYKKDIEQMNLFGCFAMTELRTSSFLRGISTTATLDRQTKEFVIETPNIKATKWWIGAAAHTATHAVVLSKLVIDGKALDLVWIVVPLRDKKTGKLLPGISAGSVGPKYGRQGVDNGWIQFYQVRVPKENLLSRWCSVSDDGVYTPAAHPSLPYFPLILERIMALKVSFVSLSTAATIGTRFAWRRRQGPHKERLLEYQNHQYRLLPIVASSFGVQFVFEQLKHHWEEVVPWIHDKSKLQPFLLAMQDCHALSSGLKAAIGWYTADSLETVRRCMAGHGYSTLNSITGIMAEYGVVTTGGGDNYVLALQHAQYLLSCYGQKSQEQQLAKQYNLFCNYIHEKRHRLEQEQKCTLQKEEDFLHSSHLVNIMEWLALYTIQQLYQQQKQQGKNSSSSNTLMVPMIECCIVNTYYSFLKLYQRKVQETQWKNEANGQIMEQCVALTALCWLQSKLDLALESQFLNPKQSQWVKQATLRLSEQLSHVANDLVNSFDYPDFILKAALTNQKKEDTEDAMYEAYLETVKQTKDGSHIVAPYWNTHIAPLLNKL